MAPEFKSFQVEHKADAPEGSFTGYAAVWDNVDSYGDVMVRGAFADSMKSRGLPMLSWEHEWSMGPIGILTDAEEDDTGLKVTGQLFLDSDLPKRVYAGMKAGGIQEMSFAYLPVDASVETRDGDDVRLLKSVDWLEAAVVVKGANDRAKVLAVKNSNTETVTFDDAAFAAQLDRITEQRAAEAAEQAAAAERRQELDSLLALAASLPEPTNTD